MSGLLRSIDDFVFDVPKVGVQALANTFQYYLSVRPTTMARFLFLIAVALTVWVNFQNYLTKQQLGSFIWITAWLVLGYYLIRNTYTIDQLYTPGTRNRLRMSERSMTIRVITLYLTVVLVPLYLLSRELELLNVAFVAVGTYFLSSDWLPPRERYQWRKPVIEGV